MNYENIDGALILRAFKRLRPSAKNIFYNKRTETITSNSVSSYPTMEEILDMVTIIEEEIAAIELRTDNNEVYDLIYKNMWDGEYKRSTAWSELKELPIDRGIYCIYLDAHSKSFDYTKNNKRLEKASGGQFGVFIDDLEIIGGLDIMDSTSKKEGGVWTNIADLSENNYGDGGERNNGSQMLIVRVPTESIMRFKGRTPDAYSNYGIKMRMRTTVYKIGDL